MSLLEHRYRSVLRLLPASYRAEREDEMVDAFMEASGDAPDELNPRPGWGEIASVLALSVRVRLGGSRAAPRAFAWGEAVRLVALLGLAYQTVYAIVVIADLYRGLAFDLDPHYLGAPGSPERLVHVGEAVLGAASCVAFVAIMRGRVRAAKVAAVAGALPALVYVIAREAASWAGPPSLSVAGHAFLIAVPVIALLAGFHGDVPPLRRPWWLALSPVAAGVAWLGVFEAAVRLPSLASWLAFWVELPGIATAVAAVASVAFLVRRAPSWLLALAAADALLLLTRLPLLAYTRWDDDSAVLWATAAAQCVLLAVLIVALTWAGLRSLPASRPPAKRT